MAVQPDPQRADNNAGKWGFDFPRGGPHGERARLVKGPGCEPALGEFDPRRSPQDSGVTASEVPWRERCPVKAEWASPILVGGGEPARLRRGRRRAEAGAVR